MKGKKKPTEGSGGKRVKRIHNHRNRATGNKGQKLHGA